MKVKLAIVRGVLTQLTRGLAHYVGLTWCLGFGGMLLAALGQRRLAGLLWLTLGSGAVGVAFARATDQKDLKFENVRHKLQEKEVDFLIGHLPFLVLGLVALFYPRRAADADL
jgi:hypothetical protein